MLDFINSVSYNPDSKQFLCTPIFDNSFTLENTIERIRNQMFSRKYCSDGVVDFEDGNGPTKCYVFAIGSENPLIDNYTQVEHFANNLRAIAECHGQRDCYATILANNPPLVVVKTHAMNLMRQKEAPEQERRPDRPKD